LGQSVKGKVENYEFYDKKDRMICRVKGDIRTFYHTSGNKAIEIDNKNNMMTVYRENGTQIAQRQGKNPVKYFDPDGSPSNYLMRNIRTSQILNEQSPRIYNCLNDLLKCKDMTEILKTL